MPSFRILIQGNSKLNAKRNASPDPVVFLLHFILGSTSRIRTVLIFVWIIMQ